VVVIWHEWTFRCKDLVQEGRKVLRIGSYPCIKFRYGNVRDLERLPTLFFKCLENFVERLMVPSNGKRTILQLFGWKMCQDIGKISGNIGSRGERKKACCHRRQWTLFRS